MVTRARERSAAPLTHVYPERMLTISPSDGWALPWTRAISGPGWPPGLPAAASAGTPPSGCGPAAPGTAPPAGGTDPERAPACPAGAEPRVSRQRVRRAAEAKYTLHHFFRGGEAPGRPRYKTGPRRERQEAWPTALLTGSRFVTVVIYE